MTATKDPGKASLQVPIICTRSSLPR